MDPRVQKVINVMRDESGSDQSLAELARLVNLSPSRLRYLFKNEVGVAPAQYLRSFRMQRARELLETTFLSVKEIRTSIGVNDHSHFVREFKKSYGMSPSKYRMSLAAVDAKRSLEGLLILVVSNEPEIREQIVPMLDQAGACVTVMSSPSRALVALQRMRPHLLIVDSDLPGSGGLELLDRAWEIFAEHGEQIPAVVLVTHPIAQNGNSTLASFQRQVQKPLNLTYFYEVIEELVGRN